jgi:hypothetical protein
MYTNYLDTAACSFTIVYIIPPWRVVEVAMSAKQPSLLDFSLYSRGSPREHLVQINT